MKVDLNKIHPVEQITFILDKIYKAGLTTTSGGNISIKDEEGNIWVTPSAVDKGTLKASDIVCVKPDGNIVGLHKPSSEFPFHKAIYDKRPDIKSIIHAHPPALVSFSIVRQIPNTYIIPQAKNICGKIGYAGYALPGSNELGDVIAKEFENGVMAVIMENHGTVLGGNSLQEAYVRFEALEFSARTIIGAKTVGEPVYLTDEQIDIFEANTKSDLPEFVNSTYSIEEFKIRENIVNIVHRAYNQGLMISSYGTVSSRLENNDFLITPRNVDRYNMDIEDIVAVKGGRKEEGKRPSRAVRMHQAIYKANPNVNSIIITQAPNVMSFGVSKAKFDVRTIPESWIFLQDVLVVPFGSQFKEDFASAFSDSTPAVIVQNDSIIVTGDKLLQTFDRLEVAEMSAKSLVMGAPLGDLVPINDDQIEELRKEFLEK